MHNLNDNHPITVVEFCAGYGGLGLGIKRVLADRMQLVGLCELEGFAQANLVSKMETGLMAQVPIWSNLLTFPYRKFRGLVDIAVAGIPCQPHSHAGKHKGGADERFLFDDWLRGLEQMQPRAIFIENVEGLISSRMPDGTLCIAWTIERLEALGYRVATGIFSARECGACHERRRIFILAHTVRERGFVSPQWIKPAEQDSGGEGTARRTDDDWICSTCGEGIFTGCGCDHVESQCPACLEWTYPFVYEPAIDGCSQCGKDFPAWSDHTKWPIIPIVCGSNDGPAGRVDRLRLLGNGVVPATAALAFRTLMNELCSPPSY